MLHVCPLFLSMWLGEKMRLLFGWMDWFERQTHRQMLTQVRKQYTQYMLTKPRKPAHLSSHTSTRISEWCSCVVTTLLRLTLRFLCVSWCVSVCRKSVRTDAHTHVSYYGTSSRVHVRQKNVPNYLEYVNMQAPL